MPNTSNQPADSHDPGPEAKAKNDLPNRKDAADRDILPGADEEPKAEDTDTGYQGPEPVAEDTGDPDSIEAQQQRDAEKQETEETDA